jgi:hypothetical protein
VARITERAFGTVGEQWTARRWVHAAYALVDLPLTSAALEQGALSIEKVVELARFATPATEEGLIAWARRVPTGAIRHTGDVEAKALIQQVRTLTGRGRCGGGTSMMGGAWVCTASSRRTKVRRSRRRSSASPASSRRCLERTFQMAYARARRDAGRALRRRAVGDCIPNDQRRL